MYECIHNITLQNDSCYYYIAFFLINALAATIATFYSILLCRQLLFQTLVYLNMMQFILDKT